MDKQISEKAYRDGYSDGYADGVATDGCVENSDPDRGDMNESWKISDALSFLRREK